MQKGDAPAVRRSLIPMALPAHGYERLSIGELGRVHKIIDEPGGIPRHDDANVADLNISLRKVLRKRIDVNILLHAVPALVSADWRDY